MQIKPCSPQEFERIKELIAEFELDDRNLEQQQFLTASNASGLLGFGRLRQYNGFSELCSLGVLTNERGKGIGKALTLALAGLTTTPVYLVSIIPSFFTFAGFEICETYPAEMENKLNYCTGTLVVEETYIVMKKNR